MNELKFPNVNHITIAGRLTRDVELKYTKGDLAILNIDIACNHYSKSGDQWKEETSFFSIKLFGDKAERLSKLQKGDPIIVEGTLKQERWEKEGKKNYKTVINAFKIYPLLKKPDVTNSNYEASYI